MSILASPRTYECCTLIATFSPVDRNFALCTWANEAAPRGLGSISLNISSTYEYIINENVLYSYLLVAIICFYIKLKYMFKLNTYNTYTFGEFTHFFYSIDFFVFLSQNIFFFILV